MRQFLVSPHNDLEAASSYWSLPAEKAFDYVLPRDAFYLPSDNCLPTLSVGCLQLKASFVATHS